MTIVDDPQKKPMLLHFAGERVHDIYVTKKAPGDDYAAVRKKLTEYFAPKVNVYREVAYPAQQNKSQLTL